MAGKTVIDTLVTVLTVDAEGVAKGVDKSDKALKDSQKNAKQTSQEVQKLTTDYKSLGTAVTFLAATLGAGHIVKNTVDIANASARTGQSAKDVLALQRSYEKAGFSAGEAMATIEEFAAAQREAAFGGDPSKWMNLTLGQSSVRNAAGGMTDVAEAMFKAGDQAKKLTKNEQEAMMLLQQRGYSAAAAFQAVNAQARATYYEMQRNSNLDLERTERMKKVNEMLSRQKDLFYDIGADLVMKFAPAVENVTKTMTANSEATELGIKSLIAFKLFGLNPILGVLAAIAVAAGEAKKLLSGEWLQKSIEKGGSEGSYLQALTLGDAETGASVADVLPERAKGAAGGKAGNKQAQAMKYFMAQGWTREQAAGLVANLKQESNFNEGAVGDSGKAYGIAQWHPDRQAAFRKKFGKDIRQASFEEQLAFVQYELTEGSESGAGKRLKMAGSAGEAGAVVSQYYERPADKYGEMRKRGDAAKNIAYDWSKDMGRSSVDNTYANGAGGASGSTNITIGEVKIDAKNADANGVKNSFDDYARDLGKNRAFNTGAAA